MFVTPHDPIDHPPTMGTAQEQELRTESFQQDQALFRRCTAVDRALKQQIETEVKPVCLSLLMDQMEGFGQVTMLQIVHHLFKYYGAIDEIDLK